MERAKKINKSKSIKLFDRALFCEGIRQTRWMGIIGVVVCAFLGFLAVQGYGYSELIELIAMIFTMIITLSLFRFLKKRNAGDFYSMLPYPRHTVYITYLLVISLWAMLMIIICSVISVAESHMIYLEYLEYDAMDIEIPSYGELFFSAWGYGTVVLLALIGTLAIAMTTTGTTLSTLLVLVVLLFLPGYVIGIYERSIQELIPYVEIGGVGIYDWSMSRLEYEYYSQYLSSSIFPASGVAFPNAIWNIYQGLQYLGLAGSVWMTLIMGVAFLVIAGVVFCKRKNELAGNFIINRFWKMLLRLILVLAIGIYADKVLAECFFKEVEWEILSGAVLWRFVWVFVAWFAFEFAMSRKWRSVLSSLRQLPVLIGVNVLVVASFVIASYATSNVADYEEIEAVRVTNEFEVGATNSLNTQYFNATNHMFSDEGIKKLIHDKWTEEMDEYLNNREKYERSSNNEETLRVEIQLKDKTLVRYLNLTSSDKRIVYDAYLEAAKNIYDVKLPELSEVGGYGDCISFGWDLSNYEYEKIYECYLEEAKEKKFPLSTYLGRDNNRSGVFDFLMIYPNVMDETYFSNYMSGIDIPISVHTPKTVAMLANLGNANRLDYDFDWFVDYIHKIGSDERGGTLELILYIDGEEEIRYSSFGWWSDWSWDMEIEQLDSIHKIATAHKDDEEVTGDGNLMLLFYKNIDGVETTGHWYNVTDEEAQVVKEIIGEEHYFIRYKYFQYYY